MASKSWKVVQAHVPMIKFRKGGNSRVLAAGAAAGARVAPPTPGAAPSGKVAGATGPNVVVLPTIEDFQLPFRFHRRAIDIKEIDVGVQNDQVWVQNDQVWVVTQAIIEFSKQKN